MPRYVLDTDMLTLLRRKHPAVVARYDATPKSDVTTTAISVEEQLVGWLNYMRKKATRPDLIERAYTELGETVTFLGGIMILPFTVPAITRFDLLVRLKLNVGGNDLRIASIALEHAATVVTRNVRDFGRVPGLAVENWA